MSWVKEAVAALKASRQVEVRPHGSSMRGRIESGQRVTLAPIETAMIAVDDVVFIAWKGNYLLHLVKDVTETDVLIGNNQGKINGWAPRSAVLGKVVTVHPIEELNGSHLTGSKAQPPTESGG